MNKPKISVVVPVYNAAEYLEATIQSVLDQTYAPIELILVNHAATDQSAEIIARYVDQHVHVMRIDLEVNKGGPAYPRNIGVEKATGEYVAFLDADDLWAPRKLEEQYTCMQERNLNFSSTASRYIDGSGEAIAARKWKLRRASPHKHTLCDIIQNNFITTSSVMVERCLLEPFREEDEFIAVEDFFLWMSLLLKGNVTYGYIDKPLVQYRVLNNSTSRKNIKKQEAKAYLCIVRFILANDRYDLLPCFYKRIGRTFLSRTKKWFAGRYKEMV